MEKALILGKISHRVPRDIIDQLRKTEGVLDAEMVFGSYDFYVVLKCKSREMLNNVSLKIRAFEGVSDVQTLNVVTIPKIRPEFLLERETDSLVHVSTLIHKSEHMDEGRIDELMACQKCGASTPKDALYCTQCGDLIP
jgi:ribosomal protein L40E/nitrate reductase NapAB chaperone NapD